MAIYSEADVKFAPEVEILDFTNSPPQLAHATDTHRIFVKIPGSPGPLQNGWTDITPGPSGSVTVIIPGGSCS